MTETSANQIRAWRGPALLSYGFRPFFLFGALWAALAMALWIVALAGAVTLPTRFDPVSWHAHALLFGYLGAALAGFLLTAVPNWTGARPVVGWPLAALFALWLAGRAAVLASALLPAGVAAAVDLAFPLAIGATILREIAAGRNWRNLPVLALVALFAGANLLFHLDAADGGYAAGGAGMRLGLATAIMMISLIGGRITPSFTRNWLARVGDAATPAPPMRPFDRFVLLVSAAALVAWVVAPGASAAGVGLLAMAGLHAARLARWRGDRTWAEPLLLVLHVAYAFVSLGALALGAAILAPGFVDETAARHLWMAGAIGLMTLAVMSRATLGHTGRELAAGPATIAIYAALIGAVLLRAAAGFWPATAIYHASATLWIAAFVGFAAVYGPMLMRRKRDP